MASVRKPERYQGAKHLLALRTDEPLQARVLAHECGVHVRYLDCAGALQEELRNKHPLGSAA